MQFSFAQEKTVSGVVSDDKGTLPGANVVVKGTTRGVQTDMDGKYAIKVKQGETLVFSFVGMLDQAVVVGASNAINVKLSSGLKLEEVVVEGYRTTTKASTIVAQTTVTAKTIENRPNASFVNTLQGQVAGLNIATGTGQPGSKGSVVLRGLGSIYGNTDPLYVIDGFPTNSDNFRSLNPNDIESTTVLKDAAAISIYGSRGANGVIVIKTKKGGSGDAKTVFRYSSNTGYVQLQQSRYNFTNSAQQLQLQQTYLGDVSINAATGEPYTADVNTDWVDYFFRTARTSMHNFSVQTAGKNLNSYTSIGYVDNEGLLVSTGLKRFTLRNNLSGKSNNDKFTYSSNIGLGFTKNNESVNLGTGAVNRNLVLGATLGLPFISPDEYVSSLNVLDLYNNSPDLSYTPLMLVDKLYTFQNVTEEQRMNASVEASYKLTNDVTATTRTGAETLQTRLVESEFPNSFNALLFQGSNQFGGYERINNRREFYFNQYFGLAYKKTLKDLHTFGLSANMEYNFQQLQATNFTQRGLDPRTYVPGTGSGYVGDLSTDDVYVPQTSASKLKGSLVSYFGVFDYDYNNRYGLTASIRRDGSSRFDDDYRWGNFWSAGARWNIDKEGFMKNQTLFQMLKLRASYGTTGNQRVIDGTTFAGYNPQLYANTYGISTAAASTYNNGGVQFVNFGYPELTWETTKSGNIGLDFELYKSRVRGTVEVYNKKTVDLFNADNVSPQVGTSFLFKNSDVIVDNSGLELTLAYDLFKNDNFVFTLRGNGAYNKNEVSDVPTASGRIINGNTVIENGHQIGEYYVYPYLGVNQANGNLLFQDINGNATEVPLVDRDRVANGKSSEPVYLGGFGFDTEYKGFFMSSNFTYALKVFRYDFDMEGLYDPTQIGQFIVSEDLLNAWTPTNTNTDVPSLTAANTGSQDNSDRFLKDASYVRLRYLQLGYKVPKNFLKKTFLTDVSLSLQGENLVTFTKWKGFDAESNRAADQAQYPTPRIYTLSLDLKF